MEGRKKWSSNWTWNDAKREWRGFNPASHKHALLALLLLGLTIGVTGWAVDPSNGIFHSFVPIPKDCSKDPVHILPGVGCVDPFTTIWQTTAPSANLGEFNTYSGSIGSITYQATCTVGTAVPCLSMAPDTGGQTIIALTKETVGELSIVSGKALFNALIWTARTSNTYSTDTFGFYLTTNATVPTHDIGLTSAYDPKDDSSVTMVQQFHCVSSCNLASPLWSSALYFLRTIGKTDTINSEDHGCVGGSSFMCGTTSFNPAQNGGNLHEYFLNFTGVNAGSSCGTSTGAGCSFLDLNGVQLASSQTSPWFQFQSQQYYLGFYVKPNIGNVIGFTFNTGGGANELQYFVGEPPTAVAPNIDTGGFFGPIIKALISIGVFVLNAILGFVGFIAPALQTALNFLETIVTNILNLIGNALGFGNIGTNLANFLNALITFFTQQLPQYITNFPSYVTNFLSLLTIEFPFLAPIFTIANAILAFGTAGIATAIAIFTIGLQMFLFGFGTLMVAAYFVYVGDDAIGGLFTYLGTLEALSFKILNIIATITNLGLDIIVHVISLIPKPVVQMGAGKLPRLPTVESSASMTFPKLDFGDARNGNMVVYWLWSIGLYFMAWFETQNPALPGSIVALDPALATNIRIVHGFLPLLQAFVLISGGVLAIWFAMLPLQLAGIDVTEAPIGAALGERSGPGPGGIKLAAGKKHLVGKAKKIQQELEARKESKAKKKEEAEKAIEKRKKELVEKERSEQLRKEELARKPTGKDLRGPNLQ